MKNIVITAVALIGMMVSTWAVEKVSIPEKMDLPLDFKPTPEQLAPNRPFEVAGRACEIGPVNGLRPIYIHYFQKGMLRGEPLAAGDVILAVDGEPLVSDPFGLVGKQFAEARKKHAKVSVTRWRAGAITRLMVSPVAEVPDFTMGDNHEEFHDWPLGPTGIRGWIYGAKCQTTDARQILVTAVEKDSPADGKLMAGDVILGISGTKFSDDARIQFALAIAKAEEEKSGGDLRLTRWRAGKTDTVNLKIKVMGTYSATAPYDCPKSKRIFELGCEAIAKRGLKGESIPNSMNALALLASDKPEYRPMLAAYAKEVADHRFEGYVNWEYGYANMFLAEYVMATGDQTVLEGLKRITSEIVNGQSAVGTWGHYPALLNGNVSGYGCMNQPGLSLAISMVLAHEAGVKDPMLDRAITKAVGFLRCYVNKGVIPYGDHQPWAGHHEDGGKCSSAAVLFDLLGDREAAEFFARMAAAAYTEREQGHTGDYFNVMWALPGVIRCGPITSGAYMKEQSWYYDLARDWKGSVIYPGSPQGAEEYGKYTGWDCTGSYLLAFAAPKKSLLLTGKKPFSFPALNRSQTDEVIAAGRNFTPATEKTCYDGLKTNQLLAGLSSWSPAVRNRSVQSLVKLEGDFVPELVKMLASKNRYSCYGALDALGKLGAKADAAAPQLRAALSDPDPWIQSLACSAIPTLSSKVAEECVNDLLKMAASNNPADPRHIAHRYAAVALFDCLPGTSWPRPILYGSLDGVDRSLLIPAISSLLQNEDGMTRSAVSSVFKRLTPADLAVLLPHIIPAVEQLAPSSEMFAEGVRMAGLDQMSSLHIHEGMDLCVKTLERRWGHDNQRSLTYLKRYGSAAKEVIPQLKEKIAGFNEANQKDEAKTVETAIAEIEASTEAPELISLQDYILKASAGSGAANDRKDGK